VHQVRGLVDIAHKFQEYSGGRFPVDWALSGCYHRSIRSPSDRLGCRNRMKRDLAIPALEIAVALLRCWTFAQLPFKVAEAQAREPPNRKNLDDDTSVRNLHRTGSLPQGSS
jgi:hypothetical protein